MATNQMTTEPTEADLEARIRAAILVALPWSTDGSIKHQLKFSFKFGRAELEVKPGKEPHKEARLDILLTKGAANLAVLELKRAGNVLTSDDERQGLSYARLVEPQAPLVIVTNGVDTKLIKTHDGQEWKPETSTEKVFEALVKNAGTVADAELARAIETLMGSSSSIWMQAVRAVTRSTIGARTSTEETPGLPFVKELMFPRSVTASLEEGLLAGQKLAMLVGAPLSGKSSVLRELSLRLEKSDSAAVLYLEAGTGLGALQALADALAASLSWPVTPAEARTWLVRTSRVEGARLILAFDEFDSLRTDVVREIEDLTSDVFGDALSVVFAVDESSSKRLLESPNGVGLSVLGRRAKVFVVEALDDEEFDAAERALFDLRLGLMPGAKMSVEYREPWILRATVEPALNALSKHPKTSSIMLEPLLGLDVISTARTRFGGNQDLRRRFRGLAQAYLSDARDQGRLEELELQQVGEFVVRHETAATALSAADLEFLERYGFVKSAMDDHYGATLHIRLPELLASEAAFLLTQDLFTRVREDRSKAASWLANAAAAIPLGELVAAQALLDAFGRTGSPLRADFLTELLSLTPRLQLLEAGYEYLASHPEIGTVTMTPGENGMMTIEANGKTIEAETPGEYENLSPWLVLSHIASHPFQLTDKAGTVRGDGDLLLEVGTSKISLVARRGRESMRGELRQRDLADGTELLDPTLGIVEPITLGMLRYLSRETEETVDGWIARATASNSIALLTRLHHALIALISVGDKKRKKWATLALRDRVVPVLSRLHAALEKAGSSD